MSSAVWCQSSRAACSIKQGTLNLQNCHWWLFGEKIISHLTIILCWRCDTSFLDLVQAIAILKNLVSERQCNIFIYIYIFQIKFDIMTVFADPGRRDWCFHKLSVLVRNIRNRRWVTLGSVCVLVFIVTEQINVWILCSSSGFL